MKKPSFLQGWKPFEIVYVIVGITALTVTAIFFKGSVIQYVCTFCLMMNVNNFSLINSTCVNLAPCLICDPLLLNEDLFGWIPGLFG